MERLFRAVVSWITVELKDSAGNKTARTYDPRRQQGVSVYREQERAFSVCDGCSSPRRWPSRSLRIASWKTVENIGEVRIALKLHDGRKVEIDPAKHLHLDHGYAVTSHSSQGQTADCVLNHVDTELGAKDLLNNRMAYVAVSRGTHEAQIFTKDREQLGAALGRDVSHRSAQMPELKHEQAIVPEQELIKEHQPRYEHRMGLGL